jgi:hypothetical protein
MLYPVCCPYVVRVKVKVEVRVKVKVEVKSAEAGIEDRAVSVSLSHRRL